MRGGTAMKKALGNLLDQALRQVAGEHARGLRHAGLEQARDARNGHYASNAAMQLAGKLKRRPADIAGAPRGLRRLLGPAA